MIRRRFRFGRARRADKIVRVRVIAVRRIRGRRRVGSTSALTLWAGSVN